MILPQFSIKILMSLKQLPLVSESKSKDQAEPLTTRKKYCFTSPFSLKNRGQDIIDHIYSRSTCFNADNTKGTSLLRLQNSYCFISENSFLYESVQNQYFRAPAFIFYNSGHYEI